MPSRLRVLAGDCTTTLSGTRERTQRGRVVVVVKPDNTTLVHDADGYQPIEWLTRPDSVAIETDAAGFTVTARDGDRTLRVITHEREAGIEVPVTEAGLPVGTCPDCASALIRSGGHVACTGCEERYGLPTGATVLDRSCEECGLPLLRVERGEAFTVCLDVSCDSLADAVVDRFDRVWSCPDCGSDLRVQQATGRVFLGCDAYPACETTFSIPDGVVVDDCPCGLPILESATGRRCLDGACEAWEAWSGNGNGGEDGEDAEPPGA
ncbi:topoisomerase DNA-binding C4 zinc finger domain-containing protein [Halopenitus sp. POP-27]|uniref:topoisomerase DNA-binding C4 zinc finger domain-containing protein n=1 Tax=Halopenitus sp. POP-27 TaxID=2994425 RepID=UPI002469B98A|nr:topoisomerase DNA-binding C4 zinc finger domain-containing protein [Halopenitus sp. POP-27]